MFLHDRERAVVTVGAKASGVFYTCGPVTAPYLSSAGFAPCGIFTQGGFVLDESASFQFAMFFGRGVGDEYAFPEGDFHGLLGFGMRV
jgi:hypothetical protein